MTELSPMQDHIVKLDPTPASSHDPGPFADAQWVGILAVGEQIEVPDHRGKSRTAARNHEDGSTSANFTYYAENGERVNRTVTVLVTEEVDSNDAYWDGVDADSPNAVRIDGAHYMIGDRRAGHPAWKGFGGHRWHIIYPDGRHALTDNLWSQGPIPPKHRERLFDNVDSLATWYGRCDKGCSFE